MALTCRARGWAAWAALACCVLARAGPAAEPITEPARYLAQAERLRTEDHAQFTRMLARIHHEAPRLSAAEAWHLRYLDAWETMFEGDYATSETQLRDVIAHSGSEVLVAKASGLLLNNLALNRRYADAFTLANRLVAGLPRIRDREARFLLLADLSQMMNLAGQIDLAVQYARMAENATPPGEDLCRPFSREVAALYNGKRLTSASAQLQRAIGICEAARQPIFANAMWLVLSSLFLEEDRPRQALAVLDRIAPAIRSSHYYPHMLSAQVQHAQAYAKLGRDNEAKKAALAAVAMAPPDSIDQLLADAYRVLYQVAKKQGDAPAALSYYEHYIAQDKGDLDDVSARALAYQVTQQQMLVQKLEAERLSRQNSVLRLKQALATKAVEASRLYIGLLLVTLASIALWLYRVKRSQLRFQKLSRHDGLTGIFNHQHFLAEADRALRLLEKRRAKACLVAIDLDHFKRINDAHGHATGDTVLQHTAALCQQQLRPGDLFGRLGGEEFGILLHDCSGEHGVEVAQRIRLAVQAASLENDGHPVAISASIGLACTDTCGYDLPRLCREADAALYRAKGAGRNRVVAVGD